MWSHVLGHDGPLVVCSVFYVLRCAVFCTFAAQPHYDILLCQVGFGVVWCSDCVVWFGLVWFGWCRNVQCSVV